MAGSVGARWVWGEVGRVVNMGGRGFSMHIGNLEGRLQNKGRKLGETAETWLLWSEQIAWEDDKVPSGRKGKFRSLGTATTTHPSGRCTDAPSAAGDAALYSLVSQSFYY